MSAICGGRGALTHSVPSGKLASARPGCLKGASGFWAGRSIGPTFNIRALKNGLGHLWLPDPQPLSFSPPHLCEPLFRPLVRPLHPPDSWKSPQLAYPVQHIRVMSEAYRSSRTAACGLAITLSVTLFGRPCHGDPALGGLDDLRHEHYEVTAALIVTVALGGSPATSNGSPPQHTVVTPVVAQSKMPAPRAPSLVGRFAIAAAAVVNDGSLNSLTPGGELSLGWERTFASVRVSALASGATFSSRRLGAPTHTTDLSLVTASALACGSSGLTCSDHETL